MRLVDNIAPDGYELRQNYPNPFNPVTTISFALPRSGRVSLKIYDPLGREIVTLVDEFTQPGHYEVQWRAEDSPSGVYFCRLQAGGFSEIKTLVLLR
jgi:hypothetical protein